jgi:hypothetical protein
VERLEAAEAGSEPPDLAWLCRPEGVDTWYVRVAADADRQPGRVVLEVLNGQDGSPDEMLAQGMRIVAERDGMLSRSPTPEEFEFLKDQRRERGYGKGSIVR